MAETAILAAACVREGKVAASDVIETRTLTRDAGETPLALAVNRTFVFEVDLNLLIYLFTTVSHILSPKPPCCSTPLCHNDKEEISRGAGSDGPQKAPGLWRAQVCSNQGHVSYTSTPS